MTTELEIIEARKRELGTLVSNAEQAAELRHQVAGLKEDVTRLERRHARLAALGDERVEIPQRSFDQRYGMEIQWEPVRSVSSGRELAEKVAGDLEHLRSEIARREHEIERLIAES